MSPLLHNLKGPSTKHVRQLGRARGGGGGFEISDIPGQGEGGGVVCESSDVRKFLKKSKFQNYNRSVDRDSNMRAFTYDVCSNLGVSKLNNIIHANIQLIYKYFIK